ncbi:MAG: DUF1428 domain-containing protein [Proteobacteria bacterium]|nr:MAG: DUF1428 domain-containing protein [Pseudomonadota bacterium]
MAQYVDGFIIPIPKKNVEKYRKVAKLAGKIWMEHGALSYVECIGEDVPMGKTTSFPQAVKLKKNEVVFFSWVVYKSRAHRDRVMEKVTSDRRMKGMMEMMPFDGDRMIFGGFTPIVSL